MTSDDRSRDGREKDPGYRNLRVWEKSFELAVAIFKVADRIPQEMGTALSGQMRIAALSIPSFIARVQSRSNGKEVLRGLFQAQGALRELESNLYVCVELGYSTDLEARRLDVQIREVRRMLAVVIDRIRTSLMAQKGPLQALSEEISRAFRDEKEKGETAGC